MQDFFKSTSRQNVNFCDCCSVNITHGLVFAEPGWENSLCFWLLFDWELCSNFCSKRINGLSYDMNVASYSFCWHLENLSNGDLSWHVLFTEPAWPSYGLLVLRYLAWLKIWISFISLKCESANDWHIVDDCRHVPLPNSASKVKLGFALDVGSEIEFWPFLLWNLFDSVNCSQVFSWKRPCRRVFQLLENT